MADSTRDIDNWLFRVDWPSVAVGTKLEKIETLIPSMRESRVLTKRLVDRLQFLLSELKKTDDLIHDSATRIRSATRFTTTVNDVRRFLRKFAKKKKTLQRIAASRLIREGIRRLHSSIDIAFQDAGLGDTPEMTEWKQHEATDVQEQLERLQEIVATTGAIVKDLSVAEVDEARLEIRLELKRQNNPKEFVALLTSALKHPEVAAKKGGTVWDLEEWFIRRDDVDMEEKPFDMGSFGDVYRARLGSDRIKVCVKLLIVDGPEVQEQFLREARIWHKLSHPNVIKMLGGCYVGKPMFIISELTKAGNFFDYFDKIENKSKLWRLFLQAAQGLSYLHSEDIIHADIKCSNLLVGDDGLAKLCDFGFSYIKTLSISKRLMEQPSSVRWKAPECTLNQGPAANSTKMSDVYLLGTSIIEAKTGEVPWGVQSEDEIIEALFDGEGYPRPDGIFTDREWELVRGMTDFDPEKRWSLDRAIEVLKELADEEADADAGSSYYRLDGSINARSENIINRIIAKDPESSLSYEKVSDELSQFVSEESTAAVDPPKPLSSADVKDRLMLLADHVHNHAPNLSNEERDRCLRQIQQVIEWSTLEVEMQQQWEANFPDFTLCNSCKSHNPVENFDCCECGDELWRIHRETLDFRFTVSDGSSLGDAIATFEQLQDAIAEELVMHRLRSLRECRTCSEYNSVNKRFCGGCGSRLDPATRIPENDVAVASGLSARLTLHSEIQRLKTILDSSHEAEAACEKAWKAPPKKHACSRCGELNIESEMFCRECGLDIEFRREIRL